jgi:hypothetical protein
MKREIRKDLPGVFRIIQFRLLVKIRESIFKKEIRIYEDAGVGRTKTTKCVMSQMLWISLIKDKDFLSIAKIHTT